MALDNRNIRHFSGGAAGSAGGGVVDERMSVDAQLLAAVEQLSALTKRYKIMNAQLNAEKEKNASLQSTLTQRDRQLEAGTRQHHQETARLRLERQNLLPVASTQSSEEIDRLQNRIRELQRAATEKDVLVWRQKSEIEDLKNAEKDAAGTARETLAALERSNKQIGELNEQLQQRSRGSSSAREPVARPTDNSKAASGASRSAGGSSYALDDDDDEAVDVRSGEGEHKGSETNDEVEEEEEEEEDDNEDDDSDEGDGESRRSGFFGWITGNSKKRRRVE